MTISEADEGKFQSKIADFHAQHHDDQCYPACIKNIIDELADRKDKPEMSLSMSEVNDLCNYTPGLRCEEDLIPPNLTQAMTEYGYEAAVETGPVMDRDHLEKIIQNEDTSLPIVEIDGKYFEFVKDYHTQPSEDGYTPHVVIPCKINSSEILFYDPYENHLNKPVGVKETPYRMQQTDFYELWSGGTEERWTLWLTRRAHKLTDLSRSVED